MNRLLICTSLLALVVVLMGAGGSQASKPLAEIPLAQMFNANIGKVGAMSGRWTFKPFRLTLPSNLGVAITQTSARGQGSNNLVVLVNGQRVLFSAGVQMTLSPALLVRPGDTLTIGTQTDNNNEAEVVLSGYLLSKADLGL